MSKRDWISVDDELPEVGVWVLIVIDLNGYYMYDTDYIEKDQTWHFENTSNNSEKVIGWCPIPEVPKRILKKMR